MFGRSRNDKSPATRDIGLLGIDTRFEGAIRFAGTLRIDGVVVGGITSEPGSGSVLIVNQQATVTGDIVSDSVLISGMVEGQVRARDRVEIFRSGVLKGDVFTGDIMIEGGAEFQGYCHMANGHAPLAEGGVAGATTGGVAGGAARPAESPQNPARAKTGAPHEPVESEESARV